MTRGETILVTGFPALRARFVLDAVLREQPDASVITLVHEDRMEEAENRLAALDGAAARRVSLRRGDPAAMDFGLRGPEYVDLATRVDVVHAAYSILDPAADAEECQRVNVGAAREVVELGRASRRKARIVWYSSVFVSGSRKGRVLETELEAGQSFRNRSERTLAIAERMLKQSRLDAVILRAGHLIGALETGEVEALTGPYPLVVLLASAPEDRPFSLPPGAEAPLPLTPVDYLAAWGAFVGRAALTSQTFHVLGEEAVTLRWFLERVAEQSGRRVEPGFHASTLTRALLGNPVAKLLPLNARGILDVLTTAAEYDRKHLEEFAASGAPVRPPLESYLGPLIAHVRARIQDGTLVADRPPSAAWLVA